MPDSHSEHPLAGTLLGEKAEAPRRYEDGAPEVLQPISRVAVRRLVGLAETCIGTDLWQCFEFSWLGPRGLPEVRYLELSVPAHSPSLVESKSMKLYLNAFALSRFDDEPSVLAILERDLAAAFGVAIGVLLEPLTQMRPLADPLPGECIDAIDLTIDDYEPDAALLEVDTGETVQQVWHSHLFRHLCPVTGQPDWASIVVDYTGVPLIPDSLLRYLVSFREHQGFHEAMVERIYQDLVTVCAPQRLAVNGLFLRRGGIGICPFRSTHDQPAPRLRTGRQ